MVLKTKYNIYTYAEEGAEDQTNTQTGGPNNVSQTQGKTTRQIDGQIWLGNRNLQVNRLAKSLEGREKNR